jgi:hypothetical protein
MLWSRRCALSSGPQKKSSSPMIPIESCYLYIPWAALNRPSRSFTKNLSLSLSHSEIRLLRKKKPLLIITRHVWYTLKESSGNSLTPSFALLLFIPLILFYLTFFPLILSLSLSISYYPVLHWLSYFFFYKRVPDTSQSQLKWIKSQRGER